MSRVFIYKCDYPLALLFWTEFFWCILLAFVETVYFTVNSSLTFREVLVKLWVCVQNWRAWFFWTEDFFKQINLELYVASCTFFAINMPTCKCFNQVSFSNLTFADRTNIDWYGFKTRNRPWGLHFVNDLLMRRVWNFKIYIFVFGLILQLTKMHAGFI